LRRFLVVVAIATLAAFAATRSALASEYRDAEQVISGLVIEDGGRAGLRDRMLHYRVPAVSIAVIHQNQIAWAHAFQTGLAFRPVTAKTLFEAASISKPIAAAGALTLVASGKLSLDVDVNSELRSWKLPASAYTQHHAVTLRELLSHTAGVDVPGFAGYARGTPIPTTIEVLDGRPPANSAAVRVEMTPRRQWCYSGGGYTIIQQLIADASGAPFPQFMQQAVLDPLGMNRSGYLQPLPRRLWSEAICGTKADGITIPACWHVYPEMAAAGLWSTPSDLAKFAIALMKAGAGQASPVLSPTIARQMLSGNREPGLTVSRMSLGLLIEGTRVHERFYHWGVNTGFVALMIGYRSGDGAVIMTNSDAGTALILEILRSIARVYAWPDADPVHPMPNESQACTELSHKEH
jgi:CubicO group peptidase (beta-lactamase class C family)